ncbi:MAG: GGDEF domain-containing protein [Lachnospiraceae bacterium]|nr:GGDEF domain-containing protein [Lachnospiraceae bacterium]
MEETNILSYFRRLKVIQLSIVVLLEITFFLIILLHPVFRVSVFSNRSLFILCTITWISMISSLVFIVVDFIRLRSFAEQTHDLNRKAYLDAMTGIPNRYSCDLIFKTYGNNDQLDQLGCAMLFISNLLDLNDKIGRDQGDALILRFCELLEKAGSPYGFIGRNGGNEYLAVFDQCDEKKMQDFFRDLEKGLAEFNASHPDTPIETKHTYVLNSEKKFKKFDQLITYMYRNLHTEG